MAEKKIYIWYLMIQKVASYSLPLAWSNIRCMSAISLVGQFEWKQANLCHFPTGRLSATLLSRH
jgi:hypothetical protein